MTKAKTTVRSFEISPTLFLVRQELAAPSNQVMQPANTHHLLVIDCSGSMSYDLPKLVLQVNNRLPSLVTPGDRVSLIWFSGKRECGIVLDNEEIAGVKDLSRVQKTVQQWLRPVGMTGFVEPLQLVKEIVGRQKALPISLFFMSDGCDNQWPRQQVLDAVTAAAMGLAAATFVEYGFYADRALLTAMAARAGGTHVFAKDFAAYEPVFDAAMKRNGITTKRRVERIDGDVIEGVVFTIDGKRQELTTYELKAGDVTLPEDASVIWYLSPTLQGTRAITSNGDLEFGAYAAISLFAARMKPLIIQALINSIGDVSFIKEFVACFGKQRYSLFMQRAQRAVFDTSERLREGYNPNLMPPEDAFTILDLLDALKQDNARLMLDKDFEYDAISRARESAEGDGALKPKYTPQADGYAITNLVWNEARANVSVQIYRPATVDLTERLKGTSSVLAKVPATFPTFVWRNYAVIKDGLVNIGKLVVRISPKLAAELAMRQVPMRAQLGQPAGTFLIDLSELPILNRQMIATEIKSARLLGEIERDLTIARAEQKIYNALAKEMDVEDEVADSPKLAAQYDADVVTWLAEQGITDQGFGYAHTKQVASTDVYMSRELDVGITTRGWKTLPSFGDINDSVKAWKDYEATKKGKAPKKPANIAGVMFDALNKARTQLATMPTNQQKKYVEGMAQAQKAVTRSLIYRKARIVFSTVVGQTWFPEFQSLDDNTIKIPYNGVDLDVTISMREVPIQI